MYNNIEVYIKTQGELMKNCKNCKELITGRGKLYCSNSCQQSYQMKSKISQGPASNRTSKRYLQAQDNSCQICGLRPKWNKQDLVLIMDHIDGNSENNELDNLRLVCPNCDSQLPTYKSKNNGNGRHKRRERYKDGKSY